MTAAITPCSEWINIERRHVRVAEMADDTLVSLVDTLERKSKIYSLAPASALYVKDPTLWVLGEMIGFHPVDRYPKYLGLLQEVFKRNLNSLDERRSLWKAHLRTLLPPP